MMTINKNDIVKTVLILWFLLATGYVVWDQYQGYKIRGMQAAYQQGYAESVSQLIAQTQKGGCSPVEIHKDDQKINVVNAECLPQQQVQGQKNSQEIIKK